MIEKERKFLLAAGQILPDLDEVARTGIVEDFELAAVYYDTPDLRLNAAHQVIRHRRGGDDAGWHLKLPGSRSDERVERHLPGSEPSSPGADDAPAVPGEFRELVSDVVGDAPLVAVARLWTTRRQQQLLAPDGAVLALVCTDQVRAESGSARQEWREAEVELATGDTDILDAAEAVFATAGIHRAPYGSKVGRILADVSLGHRLRPAPGTAAAVLSNCLGAQVGLIQKLQPHLAADDEDAIHRSRVAVRRVRSILRTFARALPDELPDGLGEDLRWFAGVLAGPRDAEVLREHLLASAAQLQVSSGVLAFLTARLGEEHDRQHSELLSQLGSARYRQLMARLPALAVLSGADQRPAAHLLPAMVTRAVHRVTRMESRAAVRPGEPSGWHEVRKAAKAVRYATEVVVAATGRPAGVAEWAAVTTALGEVQDAVLAERAVTSLAWLGVAAGLPLADFDRLRSAEISAQRRSLQRARRLLRELPD